MIFLCLLCLFVCPLICLSFVFVSMSSHYKSVSLTSRHCFLSATPNSTSCLPLPAACFFAARVCALPPCSIIFSDSGVSFSHTSNKASMFSNGTPLVSGRQSKTKPAIKRQKQEKKRKVPHKLRLCREGGGREKEKKDECDK